MSDRPTVLHTATRPQRAGIAGRGAQRRAEARSADSKQRQDDTERSDVSACIIYAYHRSVAAPRQVLAGPMPCH